MSTHNQLQVTYLQIIAKLQEFVDQHEQLQTFGNGDPWEIVEHNQAGQFKYPLMWAVDSSWSISDKTTASGTSILAGSFQVFAMDLVNKDEDNENNVLSDTQQMLLDLQAYLERDADANWFKVKLIRGTSLNPFTEKFNDEVAGWSFNITFQQPMLFDSCGVAPASTCRPAFITDGVSSVEVASGDSYTCTAGGGSFRVSNSNDSYDVNISADHELPNINFTQTDGSPVSVPSMEDLVCNPSAKDLTIHSAFAIGDDLSGVITIQNTPAAIDNEGTFTAIADDGASGTITVSINGGAFGAFVNPTVLSNSDTYQFKRTITTGAGFAYITGTYV